ncbi:unnamed protein product [Paramecium pentaurelia]|uniref:Insulin-like growth factor binding protein, N-terminal n=1 Tax=Paramecium pentaurelia TaxID=43138 RepID=A0A8S1X1Q7_9CILI|nr:unnamed protein product [Paramecium pentaurelia]
MCFKIVFIFATCFYQGISDCVFDIITKPDTEQRIIEQDLSSLGTKSHGWGVWTKYESGYGSPEQLSQTISTMHVLTEKYSERIILSYFIEIDREKLIFNHRLLIQHGGVLQIRELKVDAATVNKKWVFFYFCFKEDLQSYSMFLYAENDTFHVSMSSGGPYDIDDLFKEYYLGQIINLINPFDESINYNLSVFIGLISDMDLRYGESSYYPDIQTFLDSLESIDCVKTFECSGESKIIGFNNAIFDDQSARILSKLKYENSRFMLSGWVRVSQVPQYQQRTLALFRMTLKNKYEDDKYYGDKALFWQYLQNSDQPDSSGLIVTTYHENDPFIPYTTNYNDMISYLSSYYSKAITEWHWFIYEEGRNGVNNIQNTIFWGNGGRNKKTDVNQLKKTHLVETTLFMTLGGDKFYNFIGQIQQIEFQYCYNNDIQYFLKCHYSCSSCFGPAETHCITCPEEEITNRVYNTGQSSCGCKASFVEDENTECVKSQEYFQDVAILEGEETNLFACGLGQFYVQFGQVTYCADCPGNREPDFINRRKLFCVDCLNQQYTWYSNPICTEDYEQLISSSTSAYQKKARIPIDYEYFLINFNAQMNQIEIELCQGCLGETARNSDYIVKLKLDQEIKIECKTCYLIIDGECINVNSNCNSCDSDKCIECSQGYTLYQNQCYKCPVICPNDCIFDGTKFGCLKCDIGYYLDTVNNECLQCGANCLICQPGIPVDGDFVQMKCFKCIDDKDFFIDADQINCKPKTMPHCIYQYQEFYHRSTNQNYTHKFTFQTTWDFNFSKPSSSYIDRCALCEKGYLYSFYEYEWGKDKCMLESEITDLDIPKFDALQIAPESEDDHFQIMLFHELTSYMGYVIKFIMILGDYMTAVVDGKAYNVTIMCNIDRKIKKSLDVTPQFEKELLSECANSNCKYCIKNYIWFIEYCMFCNQGYYADMHSGQCYQCLAKLHCKTCQQQHKIYKDGWKWEIRAYYRARTCADYCFSSFSIKCASTNADDYELYCTSCEEGYELYNEKCIPKCSCSKCIIQNDLYVCVECPSSLINTNQPIQTLINNKCTDCPANCVLCRELNNGEIKQINPYFNPQYSQLAIYSKSCIKGYEPDKSLMQYQYIYRDPILSTQILCQQYQKCYQYLEQEYTIYCSQYAYDYDLDYATNKNAFRYKNMALSHLFSETHFSIESEKLFDELNKKSIKSAKYILNFKYYNDEPCIIPPNSVIFSNLRRNVFTLQYLELILNGDITKKTFIQGAFYLQDFTKITIKNFQIVKSNKLSSISITQLNRVIVNLQNFVIQDSDTYRFQIKIQDPQNILVNKFQIINSTIVDTQGIIAYSFTKKIIDRFEFLVNDITLMNSQFKNTQIFVQMLQNNCNNQLQEITQIISIKNTFISSSLFETYFPLSERESNFKIQGFSVDGDILTNSSYAILQGALDVLLQDLTIQNTITYEGTKLFQLPLFVIKNFYFLGNSLLSSDNRVITNSINIVYSDLDSIASNILTFENIKFQYNYYVSSKGFIEIIQSSNFRLLELIITDLKLIKNDMILEKTSAQSSITLENSTIYLDITKLQLSNVYIERNLNLPEFTIKNAKNVVIDQFKGQLIKQFNILHPSKSCLFSQDEVRQTTMLFLFNILNLEIQNLDVFNLTSINLPLILIKSIEKQNKRQQEKITLQNCKFTQNILLITKTSEQLGVLAIISEQEQTIVFSKIQSEQNIQHSYIEDIAFISSSTILLITPYSTVEMRDSVFKNNIVTNGENSNLILIGKSVSLIDSQFLDQNNIEFQSFSQHINWGFSQSDQVYLEDLIESFPIYSKGGAGYIKGSEILMDNVYVNNTQALFGGAFYLIPQSLGSLRLMNSQFLNCKTITTNSERSQGGTLYIDSSQSQLDLLIQNTNVTNSYSRNEGGCIYIEPSRVNNSIQFSDFSIQNIYSLLNPFLRIPVSFTSSSLLLMIQFYNVQIINTYNGYLRYLEEIVDLKQTEILNQKNNYLISIDQGNVTMQNCLYKNIFNYGFLNCQGCQSIILTNVEIKNFTILSESIVNIILNKKYYSTIKLNEISVDNVIEFYGSVDVPQEKVEILVNTVYKCNSNFVVPKTIDIFYTDQRKQIISLYNFYKIINGKQQLITIFKIDQVSILHYLSFQTFNMEQNYCSSCESSIFQITNIDNAESNNLVYITDSTFKNNTCGKFGCVVISSKDVKSIQIQNSNRILKSDQTISNINAEVKIIDSVFLENTATYGGALFISQVNTLINNCIFNQNAAKQSGGAIYYQHQEGSKLDLYNSLITYNNANVGGGLYMGKYQLNDPKTLNNYLRNNKAQLFGDNMADNPSQLTAQIGNQQLLTQRIINTNEQIVDQVTLKNYTIGSAVYKYIMVPSGQIISTYQFYDENTQSFINYNFSLRIIPLNKQSDRIKNLTGTECTLKSRQILDSKLGDYNSSLINLKTVTFNETSQDYNLDSLIVYFNPDLNYNGYLQLEIQCNSVQIGLYSKDPPYQLTSFQTNYSLRIDLQTFPCKRGEFKKPDGTCVLCDSQFDQYNIQAGEQCQIKNQLTMDEVNAARVKLKPFYWRPYEFSHTIEYCQNLPENCIGGWNPGNDLCISAHIGALCEQCDIYDLRGEGKFSTSTIYKCGSCDNIGDNTLKIGLISLWTMISILISVKGTVDTANKIDFDNKLSKLRIFAKNPKAGFGGVLIKVLTNYLQIVGAISTFQLQLPSVLQSSIRSVSNPVESMSFSLDCFLITISNIDIIYFRMIWALIMPILYIISFLSLYTIWILISLTRANKSAITTSAIYLFTYLQPTLLGGFISLLSFRKISDIYWIQGNVAYRYDTQSHFNWMITFILPSTLCLALVIPIYMFLSLYSKRDKLTDGETRKIWGYLYNEYSQKAYFWEIVKILEKGFMIVFLTFYEDLIIIKAAMIFIITFIYSLLTKKFKPYKLSYLNFIDEISTLVCETSIVLGMTIYSASSSDNQEIIWPFYIILISINITFIIIILWEIILAQLEDQQENIDKVREKINKKFPTLQQKNWLCRRLLTNRGEQQRRVRDRFQKIRQYLMKIVRANPGRYNMPNIYQFDIKSIDKNKDQNNSPSNSDKRETQNNIDQISKTKVYPEFLVIDQIDSER